MLISSSQYVNHSLMHISSGGDPFYLIMLTFLYGTFRIIKGNGFLQWMKSYKFSLPLFLFSLMAFGALSILINNFGIIARIRIPMYVVLVCVASLSFEYPLDYIKKLINPGK